MSIIAEMCSNVPFLGACFQLASVSSEGKLCTPPYRICHVGFRSVLQENPAMAVAIKTCKNCTSDSVREKFLQEACK